MVAVAVGIDLGTTNSVIAAMEGGKPSRPNGCRCLDNLDLALAHAEADPAAIIEGVRAVRDQAAGRAGPPGLPPPRRRGARFDPVRHEAIASRPRPRGRGRTWWPRSSGPAYGEGDHQLRPAQVVVARPD